MNNKLEQLVIKYLNKFYGDLEEYRPTKFPGSVFYIKHGKVYMEWDYLIEQLYVGYHPIWEDLDKIFGLSFEETAYITTKWVEERYGIYGARPQGAASWITNRWEELIN